MNLDTMFPDAFAEGVDKRVAYYWDLTGPLPLPRFRRYCPRCNIARDFLFREDESLVVKDWKFHERRSSGTSQPYRVDVRLKCVRCSLVLSFGVRVSADYYRANSRTLVHHNGWISWRAGKALLKKAGYFERE